MIGPGSTGSSSVWLFSSVPAPASPGTGSPFTLAAFSRPYEHPAPGPSPLHPREGWGDVGWGRGVRRGGPGIGRARGWGVIGGAGLEGCGGGAGAGAGVGEAGGAGGAWGRLGERAPTSHPPQPPTHPHTPRHARHRGLHAPPPLADPTPANPHPPPGILGPRHRALFQFL